MGITDWLAGLFGSRPSGNIYRQAPHKAAPAEMPPPGQLGMDELSRRLGLDAERLRGLPISYRQHTIPKRRGGKRILHVPDAELMRVQRLILRRLLGRLRTHPAATAFERGLSVVHNALPHVGRSVVVRLDVRDFFTSTSAVRVVGYFRRIGWDAEAAALLGRLCTHEGGLPQGAPTSPRLANLVNYGLDARLSRFAQRNGLAYTRYADDMTFSLGDEATKLSAGVGEIVHRVGFELHRLGYRLNTRKTRVYRRHNRQVVAGLVVNDRVNLPRKTRRKLRAVAHHIETGRPATMTPEQLRGWYALEMMVLRQSIEPGDER